MSLPMPLSTDNLLSILPHAWPFVLVDRVIEVTPGERALGIKCVSFNEPWFQGHFPEHPIMPGVLIIEALAQLGGVLAQISEQKSAGGPVYLLGVDKARFRKPITPGDRVELEVRTLHRRSDVYKLKGEAKVEGARCAEAELLISLPTPR